MMYTYTTPAITCTLSNIDFTHVDYIRIAIKGNNSSVVRVVDVSDIDTTEGTALITLTQEETAALGVGMVTIQGRVRYTDGSVQPTNKVTRKLGEILDKVVI